MPHVMVDLETLGTKPGAMIWSIGAVKFDPWMDDLVDTFHVVVDLRDAQDLAFTIDTNTMLWWMDPARDTARNELTTAVAVDILSALDGFAQWFGNDSLPVWGNGATFDNVLLRTAYEKARLECPWRFWHDRCYRTIKALAPEISPERVGTHHNALSDAITQARHLQAIVKQKGWTNV